MGTRMRMQLHAGAQTDPFDPERARIVSSGWLLEQSVLTHAFGHRLQLPELPHTSIGFRLGFQQVNQAPTDLNSTAALSISENQPVGTIVGEFNATDLDNSSSITYHFVNGDNNNSLFTLDSNGTLKTATTFDYETNASTYTITVQAKDEYNATIEGNFTVTLEDVFEDLDGDGTEDHLDDDMDGDGFTNAEELAIGSDPRSAVGLPLNDSNFMSAVALWFDAEQNSTALYGHISDWNVSAVTTMANAFKDRSTFNEDISNWVTSNVIDMGGMFYGATVFNQAIGHWDTSSVTGMHTMFSEAESFNQDLSGWDTSSVVVMSRMFEYASAFNGDITSWDTSSLVSMNAMFRYTDNFNQDLSDWNVSSMTNLYFGVEFRALSNLNKRAIHASFSSNENWGHNWGPHDANSAPIDLNSTTAPLTLSENQSTGTFIGEFNATDAEGDAITFNLPAGENNNSLFSIETNGTLRSAAILDYETDSSYTITVQAKDDYNATSEQTFTVTLLDVYEDLDGDQIEDHLDPDMDGDGYTNMEEVAYPSNPRDPNSVANFTPANLDFLAPLKVLENKKPGIPVGKLTNGDGSSGEGEFSYSLIEGEGGTHNEWFVLEPTGLLRAAQSFDYESGVSRYLIRARASTAQEESVEQVFSVHLLDDPYETNPYAAEQGTGASVAGESNSSDYQQYGMVDPVAGWTDSNETEHFAGNLGSSDVNMTIDDGLRIYAALTFVENEPVGTLIGQFQAYDRDEWAVLSYTFTNSFGDQDNAWFSLDENGTLRTTRRFDFETEPSEYSVGVRVSDERNTFTEGLFTIYLLDEFEDLDADGIEDHLDDDIDGDGYPNDEETDYGSDPRDPTSLANRGPVDLNSSKSLRSI